MEGYVKLHRQLLESSQFADPIRLKIWIWCLIKANHKKRSVSLKVGKGFATVMVNRGQFIFGRNKASEELNIPASTVLRHMEKLQSEKAINMRSDNQYSIITICKYEQYQSIEEQDEQPTDNQRTANGLDTDTNKKDNKDKNDKKKKEFSVASLTVQQSAELFNNFKTDFLEKYAVEFETNYYFKPIDGTKVQSILKKIVFKMKERNPEMIFTVENITNAASVFLHATIVISDEWLKSNFSLQIIDSKFNDIYSQIKKASQNGQITKTAKPISKYAPVR